MFSINSLIGKSVVNTEGNDASKKPTTETPDSPGAKEDPVVPGLTFLLSIGCSDSNIISAKRPPPRRRNRKPVEFTQTPPRVPRPGESILRGQVPINLHCKSC